MKEDLAESKSNEEAVEVILEAITKAGYRPGKDISICLDPAASEMWIAANMCFSNRTNRQRPGRDSKVLGNLGSQISNRSPRKQHGGK